MTKFPPTFSQRNGLVELPIQMNLGEINRPLKAEIWMQFKRSLDEGSKHVYNSVYRMESRWNSMWLDWIVNYKHEMIEGTSFYRSDLEKDIRFYVEDAPYNVLLDFIEFIINHSSCHGALAANLQYLFEKHRAAYRVIDNTIVPISDELEAVGVETALISINKSGAAGAKTHMSKSIKSLRDGDWASSVRESITAVESAARFVAPGQKSLKDALSALAASGQLQHVALRQALNQLYGYTSDAQGIRHALVLKGEADVNEAEAVFMFGACASFASYLLKVGKLDL